LTAFAKAAIIKKMAAFIFGFIQELEKFIQILKIF